MTLKTRTYFQLVVRTEKEFPLNTHRTDMLTYRSDARITVTVDADSSLPFDTEHTDSLWKNFSLAL